MESKKPVQPRTSLENQGFIWFTSSTAQGGGGSFKNRKPIGEIGCCESRMAERIHWWTERWLELCFLEWLRYMSETWHRCHAQSPWTLSALRAHVWPKWFQRCKTSSNIWSPACGCTPFHRAAWHMDAQWPCQAWPSHRCPWRQPRVSSKSSSSLCCPSNAATSLP